MRATAGGWVLGVALLLVSSACVDSSQPIFPPQDTTPPPVATTAAEPAGSGTDQAPSADDGENPRVQVTESFLVGEPQESVARVLVPLQMYYIDRYFSGVADPTDVDVAIGAILDESPQTAAVFQRALDTYRAMPIAAKYASFDPETVDLTNPNFAVLDLAAIRGRSAATLDVPDIGPTGPPEPPDALQAINTSRPGEIDGTSPPTHQVELSWRDNADDEHGFHLYRWSFLTLVGVSPVLIDTVGPNTTSYVDMLSAPLSVEDQVCYGVAAYRDSPIALTGQEPAAIESAMSGSACSRYDVESAMEALYEDVKDTDGDGLMDWDDDCPDLDDLGAHTTRGCPDEDGDGWPDDGTDQCVVRTHRDRAWGDWPVSGDTSGLAPPPGCPYQFAVSWMGMDVLDNSAPYLYPLVDFIDPDRQLLGLDLNEVDDRPGEEPYLIFTWTNGLTGAASGVAQWCCGEGIDVASGDIHEPDGTTLAEGNPVLDSAIADHGLPVFGFDEISRFPGVVLTVTLMEKDWTALVSAEEESMTVGDMVDVGLKIASIGVECYSGASINCLIEVGQAIVDVISWLFGASNQLVEVTDPDDLMGDGVWAITRQNALFETAADGAYGFYFDIPAPYNVTCFGAPCTPDVSFPSRMRANIFMCLHREGIPVDQLKSACQPYERVLPWPMLAPQTP